MRGGTRSMTPRRTVRSPKSAFIRTKTPVWYLVRVGVRVRVGGWG